MLHPNDFLNTLNIKNLSTYLLDVAQDVLSIQNIHINYKSDLSPVTNGDMLVHEKIENFLHKLTPSIPVISEEKITSHHSYSKDIYWLLDPIDGTTSFIKGYAHYVISLGLIYKGYSYFGILCHPPTMQIFYGGSSIPFSIYPKPSYAMPSKKQTVSMITNKFMQSESSFKIHVTRSALKFVKLIFEQPAFFRSTHPNYIWDLAAGHALIKSVAGNIYDSNGQEMLYNDIQKRVSDYVAFVGIPNHTIQSMLS